MDISVIIPCYNSSNTLSKCIESVLDQTVPVYEIIICDDGSNDNSFHIYQKFNMINIKWIDCGRNGGPAIPRNIGITKATGDWIAFLDSDDYWTKDKIEKQVYLIKQYNYNAICSNAFVLKSCSLSDDLYIKKSISSILTFNNLLYENQIITSSVLIKKSLLKRNQLFPITKNLIVGEDYSLWLLISNYSNWFFDCSPLIFYSDFPKESIRRFSKSDLFIKYQVIKSVFFKISYRNKYSSILYLFKKILYTLCNAKVT